MTTPADLPDSAGLPVSAIPEHRQPAVLEWVIGCILAAVLLSVVATYAPAPLKKIGLYLTLCGGLTGWLTGYIGRECSISSTRSLQVTGFVLSLLVLLNLSWLSSRALRKEAQAALQKSQGVKLARTFAEQPDADPAVRAAFRKRYQPDFVDYLEVRVSPIGHWPSPWPVVFWGAELLAGSVAGGWLAGRSSGRT